MKRVKEPDGAEVARLRKVREELSAQFKTFDKYWEHLVAQDKECRARKTRAKKKSKASSLPNRKHAS